MISTFPPRRSIPLPRTTFPETFPLLPSLLLAQGSLEPDAVFLKVIDRMGLEVRNVGQTLKVKGSKLEPFVFDAVNNPDLVPPLEVLGCFAKGTSEIRGVERLRYKETNRLQTIPAELGKMGARVSVSDDVVKVSGGGMV